MNIKEIKEILQLMIEHGLTEIEYEKDGLKIKLKKGDAEKMIAAEPKPYPGLPASPALVDFSQGTQEGRAVKESADTLLIKSPMVGTFYQAPAPDQPPYVSGGQKVKEGDVLCIIEAMKLMNEIKTEVSGTVLEVLVKNGQPVEFDQPLFKIQR